MALSFAQQEDIQYVLQRLQEEGFALTERNRSDLVRLAKYHHMVAFGVYAEMAIEKCRNKNCNEFLSLLNSQLAMKDAYL